CVRPLTLILMLFAIPPPMLESRDRGARSPKRRLPAAGRQNSSLGGDRGFRQCAGTTRESPETTTLSFVENTHFLQVAAEYDRPGGGPHGRGAQAAIFGLLTLVAELTGRSIPLRLDHHVRVEPLAAPMAPYYPFLLAGVRLLAALAVAAVA